ncbi:unnamed protein product [Urochloa humidicola]
MCLWLRLLPAESIIFSNGGFEVVPAVVNHRSCLSFPITSRCSALHAEELFQWVAETDQACERIEER